MTNHVNLKVLEAYTRDVIIKVLVKEQKEKTGSESSVIES